MMTQRELIMAIRQIYGEALDADDESWYSYWWIGSCFIVKCNNDHFVVTNNHVLKRYKGNVNAIAILARNNGDKDLLVFDRIISPRLDSEDNYVCADLMLLHIANSGDIDGYIDIGDDIDWFADPAQGQQLQAIGYPGFNEHICYNELRLNEDPHLIQGRYIGRDPSHPHVHILEQIGCMSFRTKVLYKTREPLYGMSGCPWVSIIGPNRLAFSGVNVQGGGCLHRMIDGRILKRFIAEQRVGT